jgi:hypothetical protein
VRPRVRHEPLVAFTYLRRKQEHRLERAGPGVPLTCGDGCLPNWKADFSFHRCGPFDVRFTVGCGLNVACKVWPAPWEAVGSLRSSLQRRAFGVVVCGRALPRMRSESSLQEGLFASREVHGQKNSSRLPKNHRCFVGAPQYPKWVERFSMAGRLDLDDLAQERGKGGTRGVRSLGGDP